MPEIDVVNNITNKAWIRDIQVIFTSTASKKQISFGENNSLAISIDGTKYLSATKDSFTVKISNLTYVELIQLIQGKFYGIEIKAGYKSNGAQTIFKGSVIYMSYQKQDNTTNTVIVLCGSNLVAAYGQSRMNLSLNSGINMYAALNFICKRAGVRNANIDTDLKSRIIQQSLTTSTTVSNFLEQFCNKNNFIISSDSSTTSDASIIFPYRTNNRVINLDNSKIVLVSGYPKLTSDGLTLTTLPTFNFMPMDVIILDNSIIDMSVSSAKSSNYNVANFIDSDGKYLIIQIDYSLSNRSDSFNITITAKARSLYSNISKYTGG